MPYVISPANLQRIWVDLMRKLAGALAFFRLNQPVAAWAVDINNSKQIAKPCKTVDSPPTGPVRRFDLLNERIRCGDDSIRSAPTYVKRVRMRVCAHPYGIGEF